MEGKRGGTTEGRERGQTMSRKGERERDGGGDDFIILSLNDSGSRTFTEHTPHHK